MNYLTDFIFLLAMESVWQSITSSNVVGKGALDQMSIGNVTFLLVHMHMAHSSERFCSKDKLFKLILVINNLIICQEYIYRWNNSHRVPSEHLQRTSKGKDPHITG